jgi:Ni,Fe-hydrogenase III large subunit
MNSRPEFTWMANGTSLPWAEVPEYPISALVAGAAREVRDGARICSWFGVPEGDAIRVVCILAYDSESTLAVARSAPFSNGYSALTPACPQAHLFEREVWEQFGIVPDGHPWLKAVRIDRGSGPGVGEFFQVQGGEIHEVAVGPVHAGIIEPGHFRFQCAGEQVLHLEIALGYQHRGIEEALVGGPLRNTISQIETVAGDSTIAHATAHALVVEALAGGDAPLRAQWLRSIALEFERLANHIGDLGALANDVAFLPTASECGKLRGDILNLTALLCGNRFGRGLVRAGGCRHDVDPGRMEDLAGRLGKALAGVESAAGWLWDSSSVRARFEGTGALSQEQAAEVGLVGPAARACGLIGDVRFDHAVGWHRFAQIPVAVWPGGDVFARARVRWLEVQRSGQFILEQFKDPPTGPSTASCGALTSDSLSVALVEAWRGEVCHAALTDAQGRFRRYKIVDPSFHNWTGLALALRNQAISDFPLCNKSFNLSYCGFDL